MESGPLFLDLYVCYFLLYLTVFAEQKKKLYLTVESVSFKRHKFSLTGEEYLICFVLGEGLYCNP